MAANRLLVASTALALTLGGASVAHATSCAGGNLGGTYGTGDVTYSVNGPSAGPFQDANACYGLVSENITADGMGNNYGPLDLNDWFHGTDEFINPGLDTGGNLTASLFGKDYVFSLVGTGVSPAGTDGSYTLTATGTPLPIQLDFGLSLAASDRFAVWFFNDVTFDGAGGGTWTINFQNKGGQNPVLSHLNLFIREGSPTSSNGGAASSSGDIPEPNTGSMALLGLGLLAGSFAWRRHARRV